MVTNNCTDTSNPISLSQGGTSASSFTQSNGIITSNGSALVNYSGPQLSASGYLTNSSQPAFFAYLASDDLLVTGDGTVYKVGTNLAWTERFDQTSSFNTNGTFTAPVSGKYRFFLTIRNSAQGTTTLQVLSINTSTGVFNSTINPIAIKYTGGDNSSNCISSVLINLNASDTVIVQFMCNGAGGKTVGISGGNFDTCFGGFLVD